MPVQLLLLHLRRYQVLLISWYILFATISGNFLKPYGAVSLLLAPEYLGRVNALSTGIVGFSVAIFIMTWNITTFILHTKQIKFLATTSQPLLKYCINNTLLPLVFLITYLVFAVQYQHNEELLTSRQILVLIGGFITGFALSIAIAFSYFFGTDKYIYRKMATDINSANEKYERASRLIRKVERDKDEVRVDLFFDSVLRLRKPRYVKHYTEAFINSIFKRHHIAAVRAFFIAFIFLMIVGLFSDNNWFQIPAAASITILFSVLIAIAGALSLFLGNWSIPLLIVVYAVINILYQQNIIDPRNKAYGLNYKNGKPAYDRDSLKTMVDESNVEADKQVYINILNRWKARQAEAKPVMFILNVSGGGNRSSTFVMNVLQRLDSVTNGEFMKHTFLINGASGGMLGAAYFRELYWQKEQGKNINLQDKQFSANMGKDLLNPIFSSLTTRDMISPLRTFELDGNSYIRDRGYSFEQKFNKNTKGVLDKKLIAYKEPEEKALIPCMFFNASILRDGRKLIISTHPVRFMMQPVPKTNNLNPNDPDALDFTSFFKNQNPLNLRMLTALRMNATFPFVLPNVELPTTPVIDAMDAGLRDNFGNESSLRFIDVFKDWMKENTSKVVLIQMRDRPFGDWERPYENNSMLGLITKPMLLLQNNWFKLQDYYQTDQTNYMFDAFGLQFYNIGFHYIPTHESATASLSFHLTAAEKKDISKALNNEANKDAFNNVLNLMAKDSLSTPRFSYK